MADYIERKELLRHLDEYISSPPELCYKFAIVKSIEEYVKNQPSANVREDVQGEWIDIGSRKCICSKCEVKAPIDCDETDYFYSKTNFCPNCGARMGV